MLLLLPGHAEAHRSGDSPLTGEEAVAVTDTAQELTPSRPLIVEALFPPGAKQGRGTWYLVHFTAVLSGAGELRGPGTLKSVVRGWTTNAIEFERASPRDRCESGGVRWQTVDLLKGVRNRVTCSGTVRLTSDNFVPYGSIRPGNGQVAILLSSRLGPETHLKIAGGAGLYVTARGPAEIKLDASGCRKIRPSAGRWTRVAVEIKNRGERPASRVRLGVVPTPGVDIRVGSSRPLRIPASGHRGVSLWMETNRIGPVPLRLLATSNSNQAAAVCRLHLMSPKRRQDGGFLGTGLPGTGPGIGSAVLALLGAFILLKLTRRKSEAVT
jgi:hypothetical protein